jgi:hypothetical protein
MEAIDRAVKLACDVAAAVMRGTLNEAGYHQHARGQWRKRRHRETGTEAMSKTKAIQAPDVSEARQLMSKAQNGDAAAARELFKRIDAAPAGAGAAILEIGDIAETARGAMINTLSGDNQLFKETTHRKTKSLCEELAGENPSPMEKLLAENVALCWLNLHYYETIYAQNMKEYSRSQAEFHQKRIDRAHRRYLAAIKTLAQVRKLQLPSVQLNIGEKQVNIGQMNGAAELDKT